MCNPIITCLVYFTYFTLVYFTHEDGEDNGVVLFAGHTAVINGDQIYPAVQPYANFGQ